MNQYGFVKVGAAVPFVKVADCNHNAEQIVSLIRQADAKGVDLVAFPELCLTAYTCGDLFHQKKLLDGALEGLKYILDRTSGLRTTAVVGLPFSVENQIFNCGAVIRKGRLLGIVPKTHIPGYKEFNEERWFASGMQAASTEVSVFGEKVPFGVDLLFQSERYPDFCFGVEVCEDLWVTIPPSSYQSLAGATVLVNLSASNESIGKAEYRRDLVRQQSARCMAAYVYASAGSGESTTDVVFGGLSLIAENGVVLQESGRFLDEPVLISADVDIEQLTMERKRTTTYMPPDGTGQRKFRCIPVSDADGLPDMDSSDYIHGHDMDKGNPVGLKYALERKINKNPFIPEDSGSRDSCCEEVFAIQVSGLVQRLRHTSSKRAVLGVSGGVDSTLALLVTAAAFDRLGWDRSRIIGITMPGFGTTGRTYHNAVSLIKKMGISFREVDIKESCLLHFRDIGHDQKVQDVTYENVQARERTQVLMDIANKEGGIVIGSGDLSELALGWCTYNGDHMSMYCVNSGVPKTFIRCLIRWVAERPFAANVKEILLDILDTPVSPELLPADEEGNIRQKTEETVGPYELHDFFLYYFIRHGFSPRKIFFLSKQAFGGVYEDEVILKWLRVFYRRFFSQQFKRSCMPDGPKVGSVSLSPRGDWRMPSDAVVNLWMDELENIKPNEK